MTKNESKFHETVAILVKAYLNDELKHDECRKCVIGNLCGGKDGWQYLFMTDPRDGIQSHRPISLFRQQALGKTRDQILNEAYDLCKSTGYSVDELKRIEFAFETAPGYRERDGEPLDSDEWMFNGLMAVCDVLADIHGISLQTKESAKLMFVK